MAAATPTIRPDYTPHARAERLIAAGRCVLSLSSLTAVYLEPSTPAQFQRATYALMVVYTIYALVTAVVVWKTPVPRVRGRLVSHAVDLILFTVLVYLTEGPASPFFLYFVFSLFCATLRFSWRGILVTGVAAMAVYGGLALLAGTQNPDFEVSRAVVRVAYLGVITALLVYLGVYQQELRTELAALAAWPRELAPAQDETLRVALSYARSLLGSPVVALTWEESEEPWTFIALLDEQGALQVQRMPPSAETNGPVESGHQTVFTSGPDLPMLGYDPATAQESVLPPEPELRRLLSVLRFDSAVIASMAGETIRARLIVPRDASATADDLAFAHLAGRFVLASFEQFLFLQQVRQTASGEERLRISRDLHDGVVQSLAGVGLRLHALRARPGIAPDVIAEISHVQQVLEQDQKDLRAIVRGLRPENDRDAEQIVSRELQRMVERYPLEWGLEVEVRRREMAPMTPRTAHEICRILNESLSNAARHGGATKAKVSLAASGDRAEIRVDDNGRGFSFHGGRDLAQLLRDGTGPRTLKERVKTLGGSMRIESSPSGASVQIALPLPESGR